MKRVLFLLCFLLNMCAAFSQNEETDAKLQKIADEKDDNIRVDLIIDYYSLISETDPYLDLQIGHKLLVQSQNNKDRIGEAIAISQTGSDYRLLGNPAKALEYHFKAMAIAEQTGNSKAIAFIKNETGNIYKDRGDYAKAISLYESSEGNALKAKSGILQAWAIQNLGASYLLLNKPDSSLMYLQRSYELCTRIGYKDWFAFLLSGLGEVHARMGNKKLALSYYDLAINAAIASKSPRHQNFVYTGLAQYYYDLHEKDSSLIYSKKAIAVVQNSPYDNMSSKSAKLLTDIYRNNNNDSALKYSDIHRAVSDSMFSDAKILQIQLMTFEEENRQHELATEKLNEQRERKKNIQYELLAFGIITFIILFFLLSRRIITNTKVIEFLGVIALLIVFEFLNLLLHPFLERVTDHSPVLMLLALVCIAALLVPLHHRLQKWATHKLIEKNKRLRLAAAKKTIKDLEKET